MHIMPYTKKQPTIFQTIMVSYSTWKKSLVMTIPFGLVNLIATYMLIPDFVYQSSNQEFLDSFSFGLVSRIVLNFIILSATHISTIYIVNKSTHNESAYLIQAIQLGFKKSLAILAMLVLSIAILMATFLPILFFILKAFPNLFLHGSKLPLYLCFLLAFTPGVIINVYFMPVIYLLVIDGNSIINSVKSSFDLVSGRWWHVFGVFLIILGICQGYTFIVGNSNSSVHCLLTSFPFTLLIMPFIHTFIVTLLYNLKAKKSF